MLKQHSLQELRQLGRAYQDKEGQWWIEEKLSITEPQNMPTDDAAAQALARKIVIGLMVATLAFGVLAGLVIGMATS